MNLSHIVTTDVSLHREPYGNIDGDSDVNNTVAAAFKLQSKFESLLSAIVVALSAAFPPVNLDLLKMRVSWHLSLTRQNTPPIREFLRNLQEMASSPQAVLNFLVSENLVGYLNFKLIHVFNRDNFLSTKLTIDLEKYDEMHFQFYNNFTIGAIIKAFRREPILAPVSAVDLPTFKVVLQEEWKGRRLYDWKEIASNISMLPSNLIITRVERGCVVITYAVLPCFIGTVVEQLTDVAVLKEFARVGVKFELSEDLLELGRQEIEATNNLIAHSNSKAEVSSTLKHSRKQDDHASSSGPLYIYKKVFCCLYIYHDLVTSILYCGLLQLLNIL